MPILPALLALVLQTPVPAPAPAPAPASASAAQAVTLADLVPKNTVAFVQAPSLERAAQFVERMAKAFAPGSEQKCDVPTLLAMVEMPGSAAAIDPARPVGLCLVLDEIAGAEPQPAFLIPVRDADAYLKSIAAGGTGMQGVARGNYVCVGIGAAPELPGAPASIAHGLPAGEVAARLDLGRLIEQFREPLEMGLGQLEQQTAAAAGAAGGMDPAVFMGAYFGGIRDVLDSAETLDAAVRLEGDALELALVLSNAEGSVLANFGSKEKTGLRSLAGLLDADASVSMLMGLDAAALAKRFQPLFDAMPAAYPEPLRPAMKQLFGHMSDFYGLLGSAQAASIDFAESGMRYRVYSKGGDPLKLLETYRKLSGTIPGLELTDIAEREVAGLKVAGLRVRMDFAALVALMGDKAAPGVLPPQFEALMQKFMGKDGMTLQVASKDGLSLMVMGGDEEYLRASLARLSSKGSPPACFARGLADVGELNPCFLVHYDIGRLMGSVKELFAGVIPGGAAEIPAFSLALTAWGGVDGRVWRGAIALDLGEIAALARLSRSASAPATRARVVADISSIVMSLEEYAINNGGRYPDSLEVLVVKDANGVAYLETADGKLPKDPWGNEYRYEPGTQNHPQPRVISLGSDGAPGGTGEAADVDSDTLDQDK